MSALAFGCRCLLVGVFALSAASKLRGGRSLREFADSLVAMRLVGGRRSRAVAVAVAAAELALVALLSVPATVVVGFAAAAATLVVLSAVLVRSLALGLSVPCRCFGVSRRPVGRAHVGRNVVLVLVAVAGGVAASTTDAAVRPTGFALGVFFAAMGLLGVVFFDDLIALFPASGR